MQGYSPFPAFGTLVVAIVFLMVFGCSSHPATVSASPQLPPVVQPSPAVAIQESPAMMIGDLGVPSSSQEPLSIAAPSETSRKVQVMVGRIVDTLLRLDGAAWLGLAAIAAMVILYALEDRSAFFTLAFAAACWTGSVYGILQRSWLIGLVGWIWGCLAVRKWWRRIRSKNDAEDRVVIWPVRVIGALAVLSGVVLLIVDSPLSAQLPIPIRRAVAEAIPLLLVGIAYLAWLAIDRPPIIDLIKQIFIAAAFILWGINLLMPPGQWARFVGAVVIAIYVFDLAWLMEGNLRKRFGVRPMEGLNRCSSPECQSSGVCSCDGLSENSRNSGNGGRRVEIPTGLMKK